MPLVVVVECKLAYSLLVLLIKVLKDVSKVPGVLCKLRDKKQVLPTPGFVLFEVCSHLSECLMIGYQLVSLAGLF